MTKTSVGLVLAAAAALAACQSPQSRIKKDQAAFDAYPPEVQSAIREGRVEAGFTPEQVAMAIGRPERIYTEKTAASMRETWEYGVGSGSSAGFGPGIASYGNGGGSAYGAGVGVGPDVPDPRARLRLVFENGKVVGVKRREK